MSVSYWEMPYLAQQIEDALAHAAPRIGTNSTWETWDMENGAWSDTGASVLPAEPKNAYIGNNYHWFTWDSTTSAYVDSGVIAGYPAYDGGVEAV